MNNGFGDCECVTDDTVSCHMSLGECECECECVDCEDFD